MNPDQLWDACYHGREDETQGYLDAGGDPNVTQRYNGQIAWLGAIKGRQPGVVKQFAACERTNLDMICRARRHTALSWAALHGGREIVQIILGGGADPSIVVRDGKTAIQWVQKDKQGWEEVVAVLEKVAAEKAAVVQPVPSHGAAAVGGGGGGGGAAGAGAGAVAAGPIPEGQPPAPPPPQQEPCAVQFDSTQEIHLTRDQLRDFHTQCQADGNRVLPELKRKGDDALTVGPFSVMDKKLTAPSGDKHDFLRLPTYAWPNPDTPNGLPYIIRDGIQNPEINSPDVDQGCMLQMTRAVIDLAWAALATGDDAYAKRAALLLHVWYVDPQKRMNPNLTYSRWTPGKPGPYPTGVIATHRWVYLIQACGILQGTDAWTDTLDTGLRTWFTEYLEWLQTSDQGIAERNMKNNRGIWYDAQIATFARFVGKDYLARDTLESLSRPRVNVQVSDDGALTTELDRPISLSYSLMTLNAWSVVGLLGERLGCDAWHWCTEDGRNLRLAFNYVAQFIANADAWPHQQIKPLTYQTTVFTYRAAARAYQDVALLAPLERLDPDMVAKDPAAFLF
jgi:hypothetical protein